jgi:predicted glycosyltransferase
MTLAQIIELRARTIRAALRCFDPDLFLVDKEPRGAVRELDPALQDLREGGHTRCVLGLRDVLDNPAAVARDWTKAANREAIEEFYDSIWIYGDPAVYDLTQEYRFAPALAARVRYTGYLDQRERMKLAGSEGSAARPGPPDGRLVFCMLGGGQDGASLAEAFARADLPPSYHGVMVTGPFMDPKVLQRVRGLAANRPRLEVIEFVSEPIHLLVHADRIISMGGYNTTCEALSLGKRTLIVPRVRPRTEQLIRATNFERLGLVDVLHPDRLTPGALSEWLASDESPPPLARGRIDLKGLDRLPGFVSEALAAPRRPVAEEGAGSIAD